MIGGLGSAVADLLAERLGPGMPVFKKLGLDDSFAKNYGGQDDLLELNGLQPSQIAAAVEQRTLTVRVA